MPFAVNVQLGAAVDYGTNIVHVLLFGCEKCNQPLAIPIIHADRNLEAVDANSYDLRCSCGWAGKRLGAEARRRWSVQWSQP
jgi:hypothetical protein